ncbi:helicase-associated domain-containing protein [Streptomyces sp. NPDC059999]|uniref:helicase-associated domain-containing protein n=1 Tax=Streptomyces sp. NPDC059999 TaxID=3347030 RepID=UPI00367C820B
MVWRITAASVRRALDSGWSADELLDRLTAASERGTPLPQPLAYTIKDTARTHGQLKVVRSACCIRWDDTGLIAEVAHARGLTAASPRAPARWPAHSPRPGRDAGRTPMTVTFVYGNGRPCRVARLPG